MNPKFEEIFFPFCKPVMFTHTVGIPLVSAGFCWAERHACLIEERRGLVREAEQIHRDFARRIKRQKK